MTAGLPVTMSLVVCLPTTIMKRLRESRAIVRCLSRSKLSVRGRCLHALLGRALARWKGSPRDLLQMNRRGFHVSH
jgi:hypothetical protein